MLNIKEIALKLQATDRFRLNVSELSAIEFAEALVAELAKQNEPVMVLFQHEDTGRTTSIEPQSASDLETIENGGVFAGMTPSNIVLNGDDLDAAIDAAMLPPAGLFDDLPSDSHFC